MSCTLSLHGGLFDSMAKLHDTKLPGAVAGGTQAVGSDSDNAEPQAPAGLFRIYVWQTYGLLLLGTSAEYAAATPYLAKT